MQIVYISNRPEIASDTVDGVEALMPFIDEAVIVCPADQRQRFQRGGGRLTVSVIAEDELLGDLRSSFFQSADHQIKNWLLRASLPNLADLGDEYLMSDDDSRPLMEIPRELFVEAGCHHAFFTHDLERWQARETDYDAGQHQTHEVLSKRGYPTLSYSAHMPQIIDKTLYAEVVSELDDEISRGLALDEWSVYFNVARSRHPDSFHPPRPFETLCWPALPTDWETGARPAGFRFENFYSPLYGPGALFDGIPPGFDSAAHAEHAAEKIRRRTAVQKVYDSQVARLLRRSAWLLHRCARGAQSQLGESTTLKTVARLTPGKIRRFLQDAAHHGDDPAWSFPSWMSRYACRRSEHPG